MTKEKRCSWGAELSGGLHVGVMRLVGSGGESSFQSSSKGKERFEVEIDEVVS